MSPLVEIRLVALRELKRSIRSTKGIALGALTLVGALIASLACALSEGTARTNANAESTEAYVEVKRALLTKATGDAEFAAYLAGIPTSLLIFLKLAVWLSPLLVALLGFDAVSGEIQHRTLRFWTVRARRTSLLAGKFLGLWTLVALVELVLNGLAGAVALARGYVTPGELLGWGVRFWLVVVVIAGAWAAIATFVGSLFRTPILALLTTFAVFFALWLVGVGAVVARVRHASGPPLAKTMEWYEYFYPNAYDTMLLSQEPARALVALFILALFMAATTVLAALVFRQRDL